MKQISRIFLVDDCAKGFQSDFGDDYLILETDFQIDFETTDAADVHNSDFESAFDDDDTLIGGIRQEPPCPVDVIGGAGTPGPVRKVRKLDLYDWSCVWKREATSSEVVCVKWEPR